MTRETTGNLIYDLRRVGKPLLILFRSSAVAVIRHRAAESLVGRLSSRTMRIIDYTKTKNAEQVRTLFGAIYPEWAETMLDKMLYDEKHPFHIKTKIALENNIIIGQANAFWISKEKGIANIGYHVHPKYQKRGVGYQITKTLIDELSKEVNYFVVLTTPDNIASQMLCEKLGFTDPASEIYNAISDTDKYKKLQKPYFKALMGNKNSKVR